MKIILRNPSEKVPEDNNYVFAINEKGYVSLLFFKDNSWYTIPYGPENKFACDHSFFWIDFIEEK